MALLYPNVGAMAIANVQRTALAGSKLKLYKAISQPLAPGTVLANLTEADFSGYAEKTITNFLAAYIDPAGGASIQSGTQQFQFVAPVGDPVVNTVLGFFLTTAAGVLVLVGSFDGSVPMTADGDAIPLNVVLNFGR